MLAEVLAYITAVLETGHPAHDEAQEKSTGNLELVIRGMDGANVPLIARVLGAHGMPLSPSQV